MNNRDKIREWILDKYKIKRIKGFKTRAIEKELNVPIEEVYKYCGELVTEDKILQLNYHFECECEFSHTYGCLASVPDNCEWCDKKINKLDDTTIEFVFVR